MYRTRALVPAVVLALTLGLSLAACSSESPARRASVSSGVDTTGYSHPIGDPMKSINKDDWCLRPQDSDGDTGFRYVRNITLCNVMTNATSKFTAPGALTGKFSLGVTQALCSQNDYTCRDLGGSYFGEVRTEGASASNVAVKGDRYTNPNPFFGTAAIQFMPKKIWQGVETRTFVGSNMAPFSLDDPQVELHGSIPTAGSNGYDCVKGRFITCRITGGDNQDSNAKVEWSLGTLPLQITVNNNAGRSMSLQPGSMPIAGSGFLIDPAGTSASLESIAAGSRVYIGGYRSASSNDGQSWTANYCIDSLTGCVPVSVTIKLAYVDNKWVNQSTCVVSNTSATATYKCNTPSLNDSDEYRQAIVSVTNY